MVISGLEQGRRVRRVRRAPSTSARVIPFEGVPRSFSCSRSTRAQIAHRTTLLITVFVGAFVVWPPIANSADGRDPAIQPANLDWLLGEWTKGEAARRFHMTWKRSPEGMRGILERVEADRTRATAAIYDIVGDKDRLTLRVERVLAASVADLVGGEVRSPGWGNAPVDVWPKVDPSARLRSAGAPRFFIFKGGFMSAQHVGFRAAGNDREYKANICPIVLEFRFVRGRLLVDENHGRRKKKNWDAFWFERAAPTSETRAP